MFKDRGDDVRAARVEGFGCTEFAGECEAGVRRHRTTKTLPAPARSAAWSVEKADHAGADDDTVIV